jgi:hypothetical protein
MWTFYGYRRIRYAAANFISSFYNSKIDQYPKYPFYTIEDIGFQFYPTDLGNATLSYVRTLPPMKWGYAYDSNDLPFYVEALSTQPVWYDQDLLEILARALRMTGVNLQLTQVSQFAEEMKKEGQ